MILPDIKSEIFHTEGDLFIYVYF